MSTGATRPAGPDTRERNAARFADPDSDAAIADNVPPTDASSLEIQRSDIILDDRETAVLDTLLGRLGRLQAYVGHGNFNLIGWHQSLRIGRGNEQVGEFTRAEIDFIEKLFFDDADALGFYGDRVVSELNSPIRNRDIVKIPGSGHYLFAGKAADTYHRIRADVGDSIVLTSGIRGVVKQTGLFLHKAAALNGNLSLASRSVAPPGYSYHALGDFDVGKRDLGHGNFTLKFTQTDEFRRLQDLGYLDVRYPRNNPYGVRYEPWHIRVV